MNYQCNICQNTQNNTPYLGREMMFGTRDEFAYFKCPVCSCLQLAQKPESLDKYGFKILTGIDSFIDKDTSYDNGINIYKKEIYDVDQQFDFVMLHHSLEHMPEPHRVFAQLAKIVSDNGTILIRIPVIDGHAWREYQMNWFQVDAPRHLFIHSVTSINMLAEKHSII